MYPLGLYNRGNHEETSKQKSPTHEINIEVLLSLLLFYNLLFFRQILRSIVKGNRQMPT